MRRLFLLLAVLLTPSLAWAQGYTTPPTLQAFQTTNLTLPYTAGLVTVGGSQQQINAGTVTLANNQTRCLSPQYAACNFVYWAGIGVALSTTTSPQTAFAAGNAIVGFVTTAGTTITNVVYFSQAANVSDNLVPAGVALGGNSGLRLSLCNAIRAYSLYSGCQITTGSLSGY